MARLLDNIALFAEFCREQGRLTRPRAFTSDHTRFLYFREEGRHPDVPAHEDCRREVPDRTEAHQVAWVVRP